jgi:hypothetical protein
MKKSSALLSVAAAVAALLALAAGSASAQTLEIKTEAANPAHCPAVTLSGTDVDGGCLGHAEGINIELRKHVFGVESHITRCNNEFHGRMNEDASGYVFEQILTNPSGGGTCARQPCKDGAGEAIPWAATGSEGASLEGNEYMTTNYCVEPVGGGTDEFCEIDVPGAPVGSHDGEAGHATEMSAHGVSGYRCELIGHWVNETGDTHDGNPEQSIEGVHTP